MYKSEANLWISEALHGMDKIFVLQINSLITCCSILDVLNPAFSHGQLCPIHALHLLWMVFCILGQIDILFHSTVQCHFTSTNA